MSKHQIPSTKSLPAASRLDKLQIQNPCPQSLHDSVAGGQILKSFEFITFEFCICLEFRI